MEFEEISYKLLPFLKIYWLPLGFFVLGMIFFIYGLISLTGSSNQADFANFTSSETATKPIISISVDVEGAVENPGV